MAAARAEAQSVLARSPSFATMKPDDQLALYRSLVNASLARQRARPNGGVARGFETPPQPNPMGGLTAEDVKNTRLDTLAQQGADFINEVDFPQFVKDLLKAVFDANLKVTLDQMKTYQQLIKASMESLAKFISKIDDTATFAYLVEKDGDKFSLGEEEAPSGEKVQILTDKDGNKLDLGDNEIKARIMDAKIAMAKEQRAMLRETILMGITRLVVERGVVEASVLFDVQASERIERRGKSGSETEQTSATESGGGVFSSIFGGDETTSQTRESRITVSSVKAVSDSKLAAQIKGNVKIQFKSDYFKLDNFAKLYEAGGDGGASLGEIPGSSARVAAGAPAR
jgi:hypothetical protein